MNHGEMNGDAERGAQACQRDLALLDQQENQVLHTNFRILRDQSTSFGRDLINLRNEVAELKRSFSDFQHQQRLEKKRSEAQGSAMDERLEYLEGSLGEGNEKAQRQLEQTQHVLHEMQVAHDQITRDKDSLSMKLSSLSQLSDLISTTLIGATDRLENLEWSVGSSAEPDRRADSRLGSPQARRRASLKDKDEFQLRNRGDDTKVLQALRDIVTQSATIPQLPRLQQDLKEMKQNLSDSTALVSKLETRVENNEDIMKLEHLKLWKTMDTHTHEFPKEVLQDLASSQPAEGSSARTVPPNKQPVRSASKDFIARSATALSGAMPASQWSQSAQVLVPVVPVGVASMPPDRPVAQARSASPLPARGAVAGRPPVPPVPCPVGFEQVDANNDGVITRQEWMNMSKTAAAVQGTEPIARPVVQTACSPPLNGSLSRLPFAMSGSLSVPTSLPGPPPGSLSVPTPLPGLPPGSLAVPSPMQGQRHVRM